jgi:hypothetical protein
MTGFQLSYHVSIWCRGSKTEKIAKVPTTCRRFALNAGIDCWRGRAAEVPRRAGSHGEPELRFTPQGETVAMRPSQIRGGQRDMRRPEQPTARLVHTVIVVRDPPAAMVGRWLRGVALISCSLGWQATSHPRVGGIASGGPNSPPAPS